MKLFKVSSKYYIPERLWPKNQTFPPYPSGAFFIIKDSLMQRLAETEAGF